MLGLKKVISPFVIGQKLLSPVVGAGRKIHTALTSGPVKFLVNTLAPGAMKKELEAASNIADKVISAGEYLTNPARIQEPAPKMSTVERIRRVNPQEMKPDNAMNKTYLTPQGASQMLFQGANLSPQMKNYSSYF